jgi:hypothetical protein
MQVTNVLLYLACSSLRECFEQLSNFWSNYASVVKTQTPPATHAKRAMRATVTRNRPLRGGCSFLVSLWSVSQLAAVRGVAS